MCVMKNEFPRKDFILEERKKKTLQNDFSMQ